MRYLIFLSLMAIFSNCQGSEGEVGPTGPQGDPGMQGTQGPTGDPGSTGPTGSIGESGDDGQSGDCFGAVPPVLGEIAIADRTDNNGTYQIDLPITYDGDNSLTYTIAGSAGTFHQVEGVSEALHLVFEPFQSGTFFTTVSISDGCQMVSKAFEINVSEGWRYTGEKEFVKAATYDTSLFIDNGTPYVAFAANGSAYPTEYHVQVLRLKFGSIWEDLGFQGTTEITGRYRTLGLSVHNGVPYAAFINAANSNRISVRRFIAGGAGNEAAGGGGTWENVGTEDFSSDGVEWVSLQVNQDTPYVAYSRNNGSSIGFNGSYTTVSRFSAGAWEHLGGADRFPGYFPSLSVDNGVPYVAIERFNASDNKPYIHVYFYNTSGWQDISDTNWFSDFELPSLFVENGVPYLAVYNLDPGRERGADYDVYKYMGPGLGSPWQPLTESMFGFVNQFGAEEYPASLFVFQGIPYLAYLKSGTDGTIFVSRFQATTTKWEYTLPTNAPISSANYQSLFVYRGVPFVAYSRLSPLSPEFPSGNLVKFPIDGGWTHDDTTYVD